MSTLYPSRPLQEQGQSLPFFSLVAALSTCFSPLSLPEQALSIVSKDSKLISFTVIIVLGSCKFGASPLKLRILSTLHTQHLTFFFHICRGYTNFEKSCIILWLACFVFHGQSLHKEVIIGKLLRIHYFSPFLDLATEMVEKDKMRKDHQICIVGQ